MSRLEDAFEMPQGLYCHVFKKEMKTLTQWLRTRPSFLHRKAVLCDVKNAFVLI